MPLRIASFFSGVGFQLMKRRWLVMPLFGLTIVIVEALEHLTVRESVFSMHFLTEIVVYGISIPVLGALLLTWIDKVELDRALAMTTFSRIHEFSNQLRNASSWDDLVGLVTKFPGTILPVTSSSLFVNNPDRDELEFMGSSIAAGDFNFDPTLIKNLKDCQSCKLWSAPMIGLKKCSSLIDTRFMQRSEWHCLPLVYKSYLTGILIITLPEEQKISDQQLKTLNDFSVEIALALENQYLHSQVQIQTEAIKSERNRIAQDLHDTLGQNISYLRLKLDQMNEHYSLLSIGEIESSLARMRDIADEAYIQTRETLSQLHSSAHTDIEQSLRTHAKKVASRINFQVEIINKGKAVPLRSHVKRQILYICREALNNIEKHANARSVIIQLVWSEENLSLTIKDDGSGLNAVHLCDDNHLGMTIMSERAKDISADLTFDSQVGQGMSVSLIVPINTSLTR